MPHRNIFVLNGANLNLLGIREPELYGLQTIDEIKKACLEVGNQLAFNIDFRQTNHEGILVDWIHEAYETSDGIVINTASFARQSRAIVGAVRAIRKPTIEIHLTNIFKREAHHEPTLLSPAVNGMICGFGIHSYTLGLQALHHILENAAPK